MKKITIFFASHNAHKLKEMEQITRVNFNNDIFTLHFLSFRDIIDSDSHIPPTETGSTFQENALIKLRAIPSNIKADYFLAEDSGLVVPALDGLPGVFSARFAGDKASDDNNTNALIKKIQPIAKSNRNAKYVCVMALSDNYRQNEHIFIGECFGKIVTNKRGNNGFGYDPIFFVQEYNKTMAELNSEIKNQISHRKIALQQVFQHIVCALK